MMGNTYEWTRSTIYDHYNSKVPTELALCRGCEARFIPEDEFAPDWFRNRATAVVGMGFGTNGPTRIGFRPILDTWHVQFWPGISKE